MRPATGYRFDLASETVVSDVTAPWLAPYTRGTEALAPAEVGGPGPSSATAAPRRTFQGPAWLARAVRDVVCWDDGKTHRLECGEGRSFVVGPGGAWIVSEPLSRESLGEVDLEILFGAAFLLALAERGKFSLHASAVLTEYGLAAIVGESGAGKSTVAAPAGAGWQRVADDILPISGSASGVMALPRFPQLKLPATEHSPASSPPEVSLRAVYEIHSTADRKDVQIEPLSPRDGALAVLRHTVAARLFGARLLERHLEFCAAAAARLRVRRLGYPRSMSALRAVREAVTADLAACSGEDEAGGKVS